MRNQPNIDISIRWKLLGGFAACFFLPVIAAQVGVPLWLTLAVGLPLIIGLTLFSAGRILRTLERVHSVMDRLGKKKHPSEGDPAYKDELSALAHGFDDLVGHLSASISEDTQVTESLVEDFTKTQVIHRVWLGSLATGESVVGEAAMLPRRVEGDLLRVAQVKGTQAAHLYDEVAKLARGQLRELRDGADVTEDQRAIIDFQVLLLDDPAVSKGMHTCIEEDLTLPDALSTTFGVISSKLENSDNPYLRARVPDCMDLKHRIIDTLFHKTNPGLSDLYTGLADKIVICQQIYPSDIITLRKVGVRGIVSAAGTASSHAEIFLQSYNLPSICNIPNLPVDRLNGQTILLDTHHRRVIIRPNEQDLRVTREKQGGGTLAIIRPPIALGSGEPMHVDVTINNIEVEASLAKEYGADGVGLFRSEMSYIGRLDLPHEEELYREYRQLIAEFPNRPVVLRMLDLGSDKLAIFQHANREENPCMGFRSMRMLIKEPHIFRTQLRAMLRAASPNTCILYPMISGWTELLKINAMVQEIRDQLDAEGIEYQHKVQFGIMVEVPGLVERFTDFVDDFDVFNIGSNDLTQYTLATDRNNEAVADYFTFYHPALISMIYRVCATAREHGKVVRMCGEMGSDIELLPLLVGLGVEHFSVPYRHVPTLKMNLQRLDLALCEQLAAQCLACRTPDEVRKYVRQFKSASATAQRTTTLSRSLRNDAS